MNLELKIHDNFKEYIISKKEVTAPYGNGTYGIRYKFDLGKYKVSVIKTKWSYGSEKDLWEVGIFNKDFVFVNTELLYNDEVLGYLTDKDVNVILYCVKNELMDINFDKIKGAIEIFNNI